MKITTWLLAVACIAGMTGCAITDVRPISPNAVRHARGFVIYDQIPVVIVGAPDKNEMQDIRITTIPNMDQPRVVNSYTFFAKNDLNLTLQNGVISGVGVNADTSAALQPVIGLLSGLMGGGAAPAAQTRGLDRSPTAAATKYYIPPGIWRITYNGQGIPCGLEPLVCFDLKAYPPNQ